MYKAFVTSTTLLLLSATSIQAADYDIDPAHSFIEFKIQHLGYSWLHGRFNSIKGSLSYDADQANDAYIEVDIDPASVDTNHAERDKHLRSEDFLDVDKFPTAGFKSTSFSANDQGGTLEGQLTVHGVTKDISIDVTKIGEGKDPWDGYRAGFEGSFVMTRSDFDMGYELGPASETMVFQLTIEAIRKK
jgi:polyisoprenoid-binding protein YceI